MDSNEGFSGGPVYLLPSTSAKNRLSKTKTSKKNPRIFIGVWKGGRYAKELMNDDQKKIYDRAEGVPFQQWESDCPVQNLATVLTLDIVAWMLKKFKEVGDELAVTYAGSLDAVNWSRQNAQLSQDRLQDSQNLTNLTKL